MLNDFESKKLGIANGLGYGWLPDYLVGRELRAGTLKKVRWEGEHEHHFAPQLYHRSERSLGRVAQGFVAALQDG